MDSPIINNNNNRDEGLKMCSSNTVSVDYLLENLSINPRLSTVEENSSPLKLSSQGGATDHRKNIVEDENQNLPSMVQNMNRGAVALIKADTQFENISEIFYEGNEEIDDDKLADTLTNIRKSHKPGVIILGRGNSFSLGRSEVMLVHAHKHNRIAHSKHHNSTQQFHNKQNNNHSQSCTNLNQLDEHQTEFCNVQKAGTEVTANVQLAESNKFCPAKLETLWQKAELIMAAKETTVQQVLEEFGIAGGEGGEHEIMDKIIEETIWQAVQENVHI